MHSIDGPNITSRSDLQSKEITYVSHQGTNNYEQEWITLMYISLSNLNVSGILQPNLKYNLR